jgi:hypothetical protein
MIGKQYGRLLLVRPERNTSGKVQVWSLDPVRNVQVFRTHVILVNVYNGVLAPTIPAPKQRSS